MVLNLESLGGGFISTKGILQDARLLKVTDVSAHLDNATTGGGGHEDHAYGRVVYFTVERPRRTGVPVELSDGTAMRHHDNSLTCQ